MVKLSDRPQAGRACEAFPPLPRTIPIRATGGRWRETFNLGCSLLAMVAAVSYAVSSPRTLEAVPAGPYLSSDLDQNAEAAAHRAQMMERVRYRGDEYLFAAYGGAPYTYASDLEIERPGTDLTVHDIDWRGKPFDDPIYYGVRVAKWFHESSYGTMLDFMHSKAYAPLDQNVELSGSKNGEPVTPSAKIEDVFHHLEFTHGHNLLTLNLLRRLPSFGSLINPYIGGGVGIALPHTEVQMKGVPGRTYAYQYAGPAAQLVFGIEIRVPRLSYFVEYKFTTADYSVPLPNFDGSWLPYDLWKQFKRWATDADPEGWASTRLTSHQVIGGMGIRTVPAVAAP